MTEKDKLFSLISLLSKDNKAYRKAKIKQIKNSEEYLFAKSLKKRKITDESLLQLKKEIVKIKFNQKDKYIELSEKYALLKEKISKFAYAFGVNPFAYIEDESPIEIKYIGEIYVQNPATKKIVTLNRLANSKLKKRTKKKYLKFIFNHWIESYNQFIKQKLAEYNAKIGFFNMKKYKKKGKIRRAFIFFLALLVAVVYTNPIIVNNVGFLSFVGNWNALLANDWYRLLGLFSIYILVAYGLFSIVYNSILSTYIEEGMMANKVLSKFDKIINKEYKIKSRKVSKYYLRRANNNKYVAYRMKKLPQLSKSFSYLDKYTHSIGKRLKWLNNNYYKMVWTFRFVQLFSIVISWTFIGYGLIKLMSL